MKNKITKFIGVLKSTYEKIDKEHEFNLIEIKKTIGNFKEAYHHAFNENNPIEKEQLTILDDQPKDKVTEQSIEPVKHNSLNETQASTTQSTFNEKKEKQKKITQQTQKVSRQFHENKFYKDENIILNKYKHLKTPPFILQSLKEVERSKGDRFVVMVNTYATQFKKDSIKYANINGTPCKEESLKMFYPTFSQLSKPQLNWYFYWRGQVVNGNYLPTDLTFIFLFVYELINYTFNSSAAFNISMMTILNENYKEQHPNLERYLNKWIAEMLYEIGEKDEFNKLQSQKRDHAPKLYRVIEEKLPLSEVSMSLWKSFLNEHKPTSFFTANKTKIYQHFKKLSQILAKYYEENNMYLLEYWFEEEKRQDYYSFFNGVPIARKCSLDNYTEIYIKGNKALNMDALNLLKFSENIERKNKGVNTFVKVDPAVITPEISERLLKEFEVLSVLKKTATKKVVPVSEEVTMPELKLEFNWSIIEESYQSVNDLAIQFENFNQTDDIEDEANTVTANQDVDNFELPKEIVEKQPTMPITDLLTHNSPAHADDFINNLTTLEKQFIGLVEDGEISLQKATAFARSNGQMLNSFLAELNEKAENDLGDVLFEEDGDSLILIEDFAFILNCL